MGEGNLIHIKLNYEEAFRTKKNLLSSQMYLLKLLRNIENYKFLKTKEFQQKQIILKKIKEVKTGIRLLEKILPKAKIPKSLKKDREEFQEESFKMRSRDRSIEDQLSEIKMKLDNLQKENLELM
jgi:hypothetical protein